MVDIGMCCVYGCLLREFGCHRLRLKRVVRETEQEWHNKVLHKKKESQKAFLHNKQLIRREEISRVI